MHEHQFCDSSLDRDKSDTYHLSVQACPDGFSFAILDPYASKYLAYSHLSYQQAPDTRDLPDFFLQQLNTNEFLKLEFASVYCITCSNKSTLIPAALFDKEKNRYYFSFNHDLGDLDELHANYLKHLDAYMVFSVCHEISNVLIRQFPKARIFNQAVPFIEQSLLEQQTDKEEAAALFQSGCFDLIFTRERQLILHNNFSYRDPRDITYFIMYVFDRLKLDPSRTSLRLAGHIQQQSPEAELIRSFFKHTCFGKASRQYDYAAGFSRMPDHQYLNLCNLYHCV